MLEKIKEKDETELIEEISRLAGRIIGPETISIYLKDVMSSLRGRDQDIVVATTFLRRYMLQTITREGGRRRLATKLTIELLECIGEHEANYFSDFIDNLEEDFRKQGRSFFVKPSKEKEKRDV